MGRDGLVIRVTDLGKRSSKGNIGRPKNNPKKCGFPSSTHCHFASLPATMSDTSEQQTPHRPRKLLIQMSGAPGSGKSTTAKLLTQPIDAAVIDHDVIRSTVLDHSIPFDVAARLAYGLGWALAEDMIKQRRSVIVDSACYYREILDRGAALARRYGYGYRYVECRVDDVDLLDARLRGRVLLRSQRAGVERPPPDAGGGDGRGEDGRAVFGRWIRNPCRPDGNYAVVVDATRSPEERRDYVLQRIRGSDSCAG